MYLHIQYIRIKISNKTNLINLERAQLRSYFEEIVVATV
jgi:hypothetical protein